MFYTVLAECSTPHIFLPDYFDNTLDYFCLFFFFRWVSSFSNGQANTWVRMCLSLPNVSRKARYGQERMIKTYHGNHTRSSFSADRDTITQQKLFAQFLILVFSSPALYLSRSPSLPRSLFAVEAQSGCSGSFRWNDKRKKEHEENWF